MIRPSPVLLILILVFTLASLPARAEPLTDQTGQSYIDSLEALRVMEKPNQSLPEDLTTVQGFSDPETRSRICSSGVGKMKGHQISRDIDI